MIGLLLGLRDGPLGREPGLSADSEASSRVCTTSGDSVDIQCDGQNHDKVKKRIQAMNGGTQKTRLTERQLCRLMAGAGISFDTLDEQDACLGLEIRGLRKG